jgi:hypothetical protein
MLQNSNLEQKIIQSLQAGPVMSTVLVDQLVTSERMTVQAVYAAVRRLRQDEIVLVQGKKLALNSVWLQRMGAFFTEAQKVYLEKAREGGFSFGVLEEGDRVTYKFKNPVLLDQVWGQVFFELTKRVSVEVPIMIYNPHYWFPIVRQESEAVIFNWLQSQGYKAYFATASISNLDSKTIREFLKDMNHSYSLGVQKGYKSNFYMNIIGEYLIEVTLDEDVANKVERFFTERESCTPQDLAILKMIVESTGKNKIVISRNKAKAKRIRTSLAKHFLIEQRNRKYV